MDRGMSSWERVVKAMEIATSDRGPLYEMHIPPMIASSILRKPVNSIFPHNPDMVYSHDEGTLRSRRNK